MVPTPPPPSRRARIEAGIAALTATLTLARQLAATGRKIDLSGIEDKIGAICAQALDLPPEQGQSLLPALAALDAAAAATAAALAVHRPNATPHAAAAGEAAP